MGNLSSVSIFGFFANWSPFYMVAVLFVTVVYFLTVTKWRHEIPGNRPLKKSETILFIISMILMYLAKGSPIDLLSHIIFSFHMLQMAVLYLMVVPLLYFAIPSYLIDYIITRPYIRPVFNAMTHPVFAIIFFNGLFSIYHLPLVLDYLKQSATLHSLFTILLFIAAVMMWYPVFNRTAIERKQLSGLQKLFYIFMIGVLLTPSCGLIIFAQHPMYKTYTDPQAWLGAMTLCVPAGTLNSIMDSTNISGPQYFTNMSPLEDQQTGGVIMKVLQEIFFAVMLFYVFFNWRWSEGKDEEATTQRSLEARQKEQAYFNQFR
ncbi:cytochrome c oxidase assembly factor CtaG [Macrococcus hajekii]|uniref:Cytochrome c oxidase assembly factor CtaG n=1 Tax=Macrococcus hajekii TaxID=198482 RepID=A0A4R6BNL7_9STAP|nr:cytochrome c oxidase assembly factor CtaG [Macrococcus hajekii]TDM03302.1 cytochrome c oxidase assembly factor CtaG [Macrococcus hajekii]GGA97727.1 cytochrome c oxidase assembly factor CtaG [Macrococcus hajekii]